jgi:transcriptional regulator with XRE-family HTH domain
VPSASPPPDWVLVQRRAIGQRIRAARLHASRTQEQVALQSGVDRASVVRIEQGQQSPTLDTLIRIAAAIGVPLRDLLE